MRVFSFLIVLFFFISCDKFAFTKKGITQDLDTIVNFSTIDTYPSFKECDSLIDKIQKATCFRQTIHQKIANTLIQHKFVTHQDSINEVIYIDILINQNGKFILDSLQTSDKIKNELPKLDSLLKSAIDSLPVIFPAYKMGIPVTTKYKLPIKVAIK